MPLFSTRDPHRSRLSIRQPADWYRKESVTLLAPDGQANVIASIEPLDRNLTTDGYAAIQLDLLRREFPHFRSVTSLQPIDLAAGDGALVQEFQWVPPDGVPVTQAQLYHARLGWGLTATGTSPSTTYAQYRTLFFDTFRTLALSPVAAGR